MNAPLVIARCDVVGQFPVTMEQLPLRNVYVVRYGADVTECADTLDGWRVFRECCTHAAQCAGFNPYDDSEP